MTGRLCIVHNNVDGGSSIGKIARWAVRSALHAGWTVTVVARDLDPALHPHVDWRRLYVPPRIHAVQWAAARPTIRRAMGDGAYDVVHVFQAQVASLADVYHVQYLSSPAHAAGALPAGDDVRSRVARTQLRLVERAEDAYLRRLGPRPKLLCCSTLVRDAFAARYPVHHAPIVLPNPNPAPIELDDDERTQARRRLAGDEPGPVWGYLGGWDERKGFPELFDALRNEGSARLLFAGPGRARPIPADLAARIAVFGRLADLRSFFAAIDVLAVPSRFEPYGLVVGEAAAHGVPVVVTPTVGAADLVLAHGAGRIAAPGELGCALTAVARDRSSYVDACRSLATSTSEDALAPALRSLYRARVT